MTVSILSLVIKQVVLILSQISSILARVILLSAFIVSFVLSCCVQINNLLCMHSHVDSNDVFCFDLLVCRQNSICFCSAFLFVKFLFGVTSPVLECFSDHSVPLIYELCYSPVQPFLFCFYRADQGGCYPRYRSRVPRLEFKKKKVFSVRNRPTTYVRPCVRLSRTLSNYNKHFSRS